MAFRVENAGRTHVGLVREKNEDSFAIAPDVGLYVVCDGMGGHVGGQVASQTAVQVIVESMRAGMSPPAGMDPLAAAIVQANRAVWTRAKADPSLHNMGTTVVAIRRDGDTLHLCHVGDSRIYMWRRGELMQLTRDHNLGNLYQDDPGLAARFAGGGSADALVRAVGLRDEVQVDHLPMAMENGDMYLLCCDGVTDMVDDWIIKEILAEGWQWHEDPDSLDECADALVRAALGNGGIDNTTAIVLRVTQTA